MAVTLLGSTTNSGSITSFPGDAATFVRTIGAGANRLLEVTIHWTVSDATITYVSYGGEFLTSAGAAVSSGSASVQKFYLGESAIASATTTALVVQWGGVPTWAVVGSTVWQGVDSVSGYVSSVSTLPAPIAHWKFDAN